MLILVTLFAKDACLIYALMTIDVQVWLNLALNRTLFIGLIFCLRPGFLCYPTYWINISFNRTIKTRLLFFYLTASVKSFTMTFISDLMRFHGITIAVISFVILNDAR